MQNLSFPLNPLPSPSINSLVDPNNFPTPYSTFPIVALVLSSLPPGSQGAVRDVAEAYRTIPLHPSQWHTLVVCLSESEFVVDSATCFGFGPSGGLYGKIGNVGTDIMRTSGIGPILRWVNDHLFIRIPSSTLMSYNQLCNDTATRIAMHSGHETKGGRSWFAGSSLADNRIEEFNEDHTFPLRNLSLSSPRTDANHEFCYNINNIDHISSDLGKSWETSKDIPFSDQPTFLGLTWNLADQTVALAEPKCKKYLGVIHNWNARRTHTLNEVQKMHGKLIHVALIFPEGWPYLVNIEAMLSIFDNRPFLPRTPPQGTADDLNWWTHRLDKPAPPSPIPSPQPIVELNAFSDASSSTGIGILLNGCWRAWYLRPN